MAQIDAPRFIRNFHTLFAPNILDGQEFIAYIEADNYLQVQADNVIQSTRNSNSDAAALDELSSRISSLKSQTDNLEDFCLTIPGLQTQINTLSGSPEGLTDFAWASMRHDILSLQNKLSALDSKVAELKATVDALSN